MTNLFDITLAITRELGNAIEGIATAGAVGTVTDDEFLKNRYNDDSFNSGTLWLWRDAAGAGAAPEGQYAEVSDFVKATGVITLASNLTAAVAAGDFFVVSRPVYRLPQIIGTLNRVLQSLRIPKVDETVSTASQQLEYTLPSTFRGSDEDLEVWVQGQTDDANANYWFEVFDWYVKQTTTGTAKTLVFLTQPEYIRELSLRWDIPHAAMSAYDDELDESVSVDLVTWRTAVELLKWRKRQPGVKDDSIDEHIAELNGMLAEEEWRQPAQDSIKLATMGNVNYPVHTED